MGGTMGVVSGRIQPQNYTPVDGSYALCLGADLTNVSADLDSGDYVEFTQDVDVTSYTMVTFSVKFAQPDNSGAGLTFKLTAYVGAKSVVIQPTDGTTQEFVTRTINVCTLSGVQTIGLKLEAV
jgi:hypothetical protein